MREYPDRHPPGSHWSTDVAYQILDVLPDDALNDVEYAFVLGLIIGALEECARTGAPIQPRPNPFPKLKRDH